MRTKGSAKLLTEVNSDAELSSSTSEEEVDSEEEVSSDISGDKNGIDGEISKPLGQKQGEKAPITISLQKFCKVCKQKGHEAGFRGATYIDCPKKPCFLCRMPGHTTSTCPHRIAMEYGVVPAPRKNTQNTLTYVFERQLKANISRIKPAFVIPDQLEYGIIKFHSRRITCLEFHPCKSNILLSGDKKGQLGIWDYSKAHDKIVYGHIHSCILNNMKLNPTNDGILYTSSSDGKVACTDLETGYSYDSMDLNPNGWNGPATWRMLYGMDVNCEKSFLLVADNFGYLYLIDTRTNEKIGDPILIHKKGTKVVGLHCNPIQPDLLLSCGNDHFARLWDVRRLEEGLPLDNLPHDRVVNSAYFSPLTGSKILSTSQDNRLRIWDNIFGNIESPSREIVHSHSFNRHLTPFRAEWDPKDPSESLAVIGRYISENYNGIALHPIDFIDISTGQLVAEVMTPEITTISPVIKLHPRDDIMASGSSRSIFVWKPKLEEEVVPTGDARKIVFPVSQKFRKKHSDGSDGDDSDGVRPKGKKPNSNKYKLPRPSSVKSIPRKGDPKAK